MKKETACKIIVSALKEKVSRSLSTFCGDRKHFHNKVRYVSRVMGMSNPKLVEMVFWYFIDTEKLDDRDYNHLRIFKGSWQSTLNSIGYVCLVRNNSNR